MLAEKLCPKCGAVKTADAFGRVTVRGKQELRCYCKACRSDEAHSRRRKSPDLVRAQQKAAGERYRATERGIARLKGYDRRKSLRAFMERRRTIACIVCGVVWSPLFGVHSTVKTCSEACRVTNNSRRARVQCALRRARRRSACIDHVDPLVVFERDGWRCRCCGLETPSQLRGTFEDSAPELDHVVPLSRGGEHSYRNTRLLCRACNIRKRDRMPPSGQGFMVADAEAAATARRVTLREKRSVIGKRLWSDPEYRERMMASRRAAAQRNRAA